MSLLQEKTILLTRLFEALGPDRVERGLTATGHFWETCFLGRAIDGSGEHFHEVCPQANGVNILDVAHLWDHDEQWFRHITEEWLELNRRQAVEPALTGYAVR